MPRGAPWRWCGLRHPGDDGGILTRRLRRTLRTCGHRSGRRIGEEAVALVMAVVWTLRAGFSVEGLERGMRARLGMLEGLMRMGTLRVNVLAMTKEGEVLLGGP